MTLSQGSVASELRERAGKFVDDHVGLWLEVQDSGAVVLAGHDPVELFAAAADWLRERPEHTVQDVHWERRGTEPAFALRLLLSRPAVGVDDLTAAQKI